MSQPKAPPLGTALHGVALVVLVLYAVVGLVVGGLAMGADGFVVLIGLGIIAGSLLVLAGAFCSRTRPLLGGRLVIVGAIVASALLGVFAALWESSDWRVLLEASVAFVPIFGGIPIAIGAGYRRRGGATHVGLRLRRPRLRRRRSSRNSR